MESLAVSVDASRFRRWHPESATRLCATQFIAWAGERTAPDAGFKITHGAEM